MEATAVGVFAVFKDVPRIIHSEYIRYAQARCSDASAMRRSDAGQAAEAEKIGVASREVAGDEGCPCTLGRSRCGRPSKDTRRSEGSALGEFSGWQVGGRWWLW